MTVGELMEVLKGLPPDLEVILRTSTSSEPFNFNFSDNVDIIKVEVDPGDFETFVVLSEEDNEPPLEIMRFLN